MSAASANVPVWERGAPQRLAALHGAERADVCVIGLGASGLACLLTLRSHGMHALGVDAERAGAGAAGRNAGFLLAGTAAFYHDAVRRYGRDRALAIYHATRAEIDRTEADLPALLRRVGSLRVAASAEEAVDCATQLETMRTDALPVQRYDGPEGSGLLFPQDAVIDPLARCRELAARARHAGARLFEHSRVQRVARGRVETEQGSVQCGAVVVAVDGGLERLLPELGGRVRTARLQMLATAPTTEITLPRPVYARWGYEYWRQLEDGRITLGGFRDRAGEAEWTEEREPSSAVQHLLERHLRTVLHVRAAIEHRWAASAGFTASGLPVCEEVRAGVWALGGYCGTGNLIGTLCGRAVGHHVAGAPTHPDAAFLRLIAEA